MDKTDSKKAILEDIAYVESILKTAYEAKWLGILDIHPFMTKIEFWIQTIKTKVENTDLK